MGQTLENGVYLPSEGERNCYAGLKTNWEILDQKVADVTALQQAVAGALHREIVESLPTTDIDPNTIYMILSGTSATENVYNEFMYVNNAWELIGTSATDLTNYYTKAEVDGKLLLKANASDLTSHTGDTTIHVTTADKNKWNNGVTQSYVFRYSSTALVASSTNSNTLLDNTDNLKVGDKVIDSNGVLFSITAIDTINSTFTVGTALIDLAKDIDVVHTSGNETITGTKTFDNVDLPFKNSAELGVSGGSTNITFSDKNGQLLCALKTTVFSSGTPVFQINLTQKVDNTIYTTNGIVVYQSVNSKVIQVRPTLANDNADGLKVELGSSANRYNRIYGLAYYYGNNNVEFSTKFVTTDTAQTISGVKTFADVPVFTSFNGIRFRCAHNSNAYVTFRNSNQANPGSIILTAHDGNIGTTIHLVDKTLIPYNTNDIDLGTASRKWKSFNGLNPSSLSMPDLGNGIDISSYFDLSLYTGQTYTPTVNGWISISITSPNRGSILCESTGLSQTAYGVTDPDDSTKYRVSILISCQKNQTLTTYIRASGGTINFAKFYPCMGNV